MNILDKNLCLVLNANWAPIGHVSIRKAIVAMCSEANGQKAAMGMDMTTEIDDNGLPVLISSRPVEWNEWLTLTVRDEDLYVASAHQKVRAPTVIVCGYTKVPTKKPRLSKTAIMKRDGYRCQYTGEELPASDLNLDHVLPRDRGGKDSWLNLVTCRKDINFKKGNKLNSEAGLKLIRQPKEPAPMPVIVQPEDAAHQSWLPFLFK